MTRTRVALTRSVALLLATATMLTGCFMPLDTPGVDLFVEPAYNDDEILISYSLQSTGSSAQARWTLSRFETGTMTWVEIDSREIRLPNGTSGVLQLGFLDEAKYELTFELLTTRDGSYDAVPYLTQRREFYVDRTAPTTPLPPTINYYEGGILVAPPPPSFSDYVEAEIFAPAYDADRESPTVILARVGEALPPLIEDVQPERFTLWKPGDGDPPNTLYYVAIDEAGNRGNLEIVTFP